MAEKKDTQASTDVGQAEVEKKQDEELEQGFQGVKVDPTPNENYSLETPPTAPTPETDPALAAKARQQLRGEEA